MKRRRLSIYIDGAARGNPGPAGVGVVICREDGAAIDNISRYIGEATNNVAEYRALIYGLKRANSLGADEVSINTDSELLASQLAGRYKVKNEALKLLFAEAMKLIRDFRDAEISRIPRQKNRGADRLANKALDSKRAVGKKAPIKNIKIKTGLL